MKNLTIHYKQYYFNYDNTSLITFGTDTMSVWDDAGKVQHITFTSKQECKNAKERLENGLINGHVFIELGDIC